MKKPDDALSSEKTPHPRYASFHPTKETFKRWAEEEERWRQEGLSEYELLERRFRSWREKYGETTWM